MNQIFETELLNNAIKIGDEIIEKATLDSNGIYWRTAESVTPYNDVVTGVSETIYTGVSGILLFYVELYQATKTPIYLRYINTGAEWLIKYCEKNRPTHGFYSGRMGTAYTLMKIAEVDKKIYYQQKAIEIALPFKNITNVPVYNFNLNNGLAGTLFGLLKLHAEIKQDWILDAVYEGTEFLIKNTKSNGVGFYWDMHYFDSVSKSTKPLCSLPLGPSGVGLLFLHLSVYFNNSDYLFIAKQAFNYEDQYWNKISENWPDFRIKTKAQDLKKMRISYSKGDYSRFIANNECYNWMFGRIGVSFARLQAGNFFDDVISSSELRNVVKKVTFDISNAELPNYTLATGKTGVGLLLLELFFLENDKTYLEQAGDIAKQAIDKSRISKFYQFGFDTTKEYEDDSLLTGNAGIGYFYLKLLNRKNKCVLFPHLPKPFNSGLVHKLHHFEKNKALDVIIDTWYPHTTRILNNKNLLDRSLLNIERLKDSLAFQIEQIIMKTGDDYLKDAYEYEQAKQNFQKLISANYCLFNFCNDFEVLKNKSSLAYKSRQHLMNATLQLNQYAQFTECKWDWTKNSINNFHDASETYTLYAPDGNEYLLSKMQHVVLRQFLVPQKVRSVYELLIDQQYVNNENPEHLREGFISLIKSFAEIGVLTFINKYVMFKRYFNDTSKNKFSESISFQPKTLYSQK